MSRADEDQDIAALLNSGDERALSEMARRFRGPAHAALDPLPEDEREAALRAALVIAWNEREQRGEQALAPWFYGLLARASGSGELAERLPKEAGGWADFELQLDDEELPDDDAARRTVAAVLRDPALIRSAPKASIEITAPPAEAPRARPAQNRALLILILIVGLADLAATSLLPRVAAPAAPLPDRLTGTDLRVTCDADSDRVDLVLWLDDQTSSPRYQRSGPLVADPFTIKRSELPGPKHRLRYRIRHRRDADAPNAVAPRPWRVLIVLEQKVPGARDLEDFEAWIPLNKVELSAAIATPARAEQRDGQSVDIYEGDLLLVGD